MAIEEKAANMQATTPGVPDRGLPKNQWWNEALHGVADGFRVIFNPAGSSELSFATSFPLSITMGAAFNDDLINQIAEVIAKEGGAYINKGMSGVDYWTPNINPFRDPRCSRGLEVPGEDPYHLQQYVESLFTAPLEKKLIIFAVWWCVMPGKR